MSAHFSSPQDNVLQMALREGMTVGDLGSGSGHYARAAAAIVGPKGKVYAVDVQEDVLKHLKLNTHEKHVHTIETVWGDIEKPGGTHLHDQSLDAAILANTLFQVENRFALLQEIRRILKPGGTLLVVDWAGSFGGIGPASQYVLPEHEMETLFIDRGFHKIKSFRAGPHHYACVFTAP